MFHVKQRIAAYSFRPNQNYYTHETAKFQRKQAKNCNLKANTFSLTVWRKREIKRIRSKKGDDLKSSRRSPRRVRAGVVSRSYIDATHGARR